MRLPRASSAGKLEAVVAILNVILLVSQFAGAPVFAQASNSPSNLQLDPNRVARDLFQNEIQGEIRDQSLWCFHELEEEQGQKKLSAVCQSKDGQMDRLLEVNGQELSPSQRQAEDARLQRLLNHPDVLRKKQKKEQEDSKQSHDLMKMFPDAFRFQYEGMQGNLMELKFTPNPDFHPSGRAAQVFHHMEGSVLLDPEQKRLAEITGQLTSDVKFGWGLLGHLDQGGTFFVKQQDLGAGRWELAELNVQMNGKALFFKTISVRQHQIFSDFRPEPDGTTPQQAVEFLRQDPAFR
jgi:hypothetical protein